MDICFLQNTLEAIRKRLLLMHPTRPIKKEKKKKKDEHALHAKANHNAQRTKTETICCNSPSSLYSDPSSLGSGLSSVVGLLASPTPNGSDAVVMSGAAAELMLLA